MSEVIEIPYDRSVALRSLAGLGAVAMVGGAFAVWYFDPTKASFFPACPLYSMTGYACSGCGMTRGFHALLHGDIVTALDYNAMIPFALPFFGYIFFSLVSFALRGRGLLMGNWNLVLLWSTLGLLLVFGVIRNLPFYPFTILFP